MYLGHNNHSNFNDLQQDIQKSRNQQQKMEFKFQELMRERDYCELAAVKTKSKQHKKFVEEQRRRAERNDSLLKMMDRVDYQAALLAAKSERLKLLKHQYELSLIHSWKCQIKQPTQIRETSTIAAQTYQCPKCNHVNDKNTSMQPISHTMQSSIEKLTSFHNISTTSQDLYNQMITQTIHHPSNLNVNEQNERLFATQHANMPTEHSPLDSVPSSSNNREKCPPQLMPSLTAPLLNLSFTQQSMNRDEENTIGKPQSNGDGLMEQVISHSHENQNNPTTTFTKNGTKLLSDRTEQTTELANKIDTTTKNENLTLNADEGYENIHQVWGKVVEVDEAQPQNDMQSSVIDDKQEKFLENLISRNADEKIEPQQTIDKIEEAYYGEKIQPYNESSSADNAVSGSQFEPENTIFYQEIVNNNDVSVLHENISDAAIFHSDNNAFANNGNGNEENNNQTQQSVNNYAESDNNTAYDASQPQYNVEGYQLEQNNEQSADTLLENNNNNNIKSDDDINVLQTNEQTDNNYYNQNDENNTTDYQITQQNENYVNHDEQQQVPLEQNYGDNSQDDHQNLVSQELNQTNEYYDETNTTNVLNETDENYHGTTTNLNQNYSNEAYENYENGENYVPEQQQLPDNAYYNQNDESGENFYNENNEQVQQQQLQQPQTELYENSSNYQVDGYDAGYENQYEGQQQQYNEAGNVNETTEGGFTIQSDTDDSGRALNQNPDGGMANMENESDFSAT